MTNTTQPRKYPLRMPKNWTPPFPSYLSEFDPHKTAISMALLGIQFDPTLRETALTAILKLKQLLHETQGCDHVDLAECELDNTGHSQLVVTSYWLNGEKLSDFFDHSEFNTLWNELSNNAQPFGVYREVFNIPMSRYEIVHSHTDHIVGASSIRDGVTDEIATHAYWGSMRDRIPDSASDLFEPKGPIDIVSKGDNHTIVTANENLAIIRSDQNMISSQGEEKDEYYQDVYPTLVEGMRFLRDEGEEVDCYDCRFMCFLDDEGNRTVHTFGYAYFRSLAALENWSEHHPTHKAIFNSFKQYIPKHIATIGSRFGHEVSVLPQKNQYAEYINCKPNTGLLNGLHHKA